MAKEVGLTEYFKLKINRLFESFKSSASSVKKSTLNTRTTRVNNVNVNQSGLNNTILTDDYVQINGKTYYKVSPTYERTKAEMDTWNEDFRKEMDDFAKAMREMGQDMKDSFKW